MDRRISRRDFDRAALAVGAAAATGCHHYRPACPSTALPGDDPLDGYEPKCLTREQCLTLAAAAEVMIADCPPVISAAEVARRADRFLATVEAPAVAEMRTALIAVEDVSVFLSIRLTAFSSLPLDDRKRVLRELAQSPHLRDAYKVVKLLTVFPYYSHPEARRAIGFVDFDHRPRHRGLPVLTERPVIPEPADFG